LRPADLNRPGTSESQAQENTKSTNFKEPKQPFRVKRTDPSGFTNHHQSHTNHRPKSPNSVDPAKMKEMVTALPPTSPLQQKRQQEQKPIHRANRNKHNWNHLVNGGEDRTKGDRTPV